MDKETGIEDCQWYVVYTRRNQDERANNNLVAWGIETLYAKLKTRRNRYITEPLFPRYIIARFNAREQLSKILFTRGVQNVLYFGDRPACVSEEIIEIIRARIDQSGFVQVSNNLKPEDKAVIAAEPLRDLIEMFEREVEGRERSMILLRAIQYQASSGG